MHQDVQELVALSDEAYRIYNNGRTEIARCMNSMHGVNETTRYWSTIIGPTAFSIIHALLIRYQAIRECNERCRKSLVVKVEEDDYVTPVLAKGLWKELANNDALNAQLFSMAAGCLNISAEEYCSVQSHDYEDFESKSIDVSLCDRLSHALGYRNRGFSSEIACYQMRMSTRRHKLALLLYTQGKAWPVTDFPDPFDGLSGFTRDINVDMRQKFASIVRSNAIEQMCVRGLSHVLPFVHVEGFTKVREAVDKLIDKHGVPKIIVCGIVELYPVHRTWVAECAKQGAKVIGVQHGSSYGDTIHNIWASLEREYSDRFMTWGWEDERMDVGMPAVRLLHLDKKHVSLSKRSRHTRILWVTTGATELRNYPYPPIPQIHVLWNPDNIRTEGALFYSALEDKFRNELCLRAKPGYSEVADHAVQVIPNLATECEETLEKQVRECRLAVIDHFPSTSLYELLTIDMPVIVFDRKAKTIMRRRPDRHLDRLIDVGIIHTCPIKAARKVNEIYDDIEEWWMAQNRRRVVEKVRSTYARTERHGTKIIAKFLNSVVSDSTET